MIEKPIVDMTRDSDLHNLRWIHDECGGPRAAYAWAIGRIPLQGPLSTDTQFRTADLDASKVEDFIFKFYAAYNARFGAHY